MSAKRRVETMAENRAKLIAAARKAFAAQGYAAASMDALTAEAGLTRGALYHNFGDKRGLLAAVVDQIDGEMAARAQAVGAAAGGGAGVGAGVGAGAGAASADDAWRGLLAEGAAYIEMALDPEVQRIVLLDGPAVLGDPSHWPSQDSCLKRTRQAVERLIASGLLKPVDAEAAARLLTGAALNAALWIAASDDPRAVLPKAVEAFRALAEGLLSEPT
ncbi:MAG: TetR/AcrR family transcriptional regulator [Pseudomonadota bacterium]